MNRLVDDDNIMNLYSEGKLANAIAIGTMAVSSVFGGNMETFIQQWSEYYQTSNDPAKELRAKEVLEDGITIPKPALNAINVAANIFDGDMGFSADTIRKMLILTGEIESGYLTKVQYNGGPARSYWQVEPATVIDHFKTGSELMGPKFRNQFPREVEIMEGMLDNPDIRLVQKLTEQNDEFGAAMAAMTWIRQVNK